MLTLIVIIIGIVFGLLLQVYLNRHPFENKLRNYSNEVVDIVKQKYKYGYYIIAGFLFVLSMVVAVNYWGNLPKKAYLENFYENNSSVYEVAATKTATYLSTEQFTQQIIAGSIEKQQLSTEISKRIAEWRDSVVSYNQILKEYNIYKDNIFIGLFIPELNDDIKPLQIQ